MNLTEKKRHTHECEGHTSKNKNKITKHKTKSIK